jgi:hypothetical protein
MADPHRPQGCMNVRTVGIQKDMRHMINDKTVRSIRQRCTSQSISTTRSLLYPYQRLQASTIPIHFTLGNTVLKHLTKPLIMVTEVSPIDDP